MATSLESKNRNVIPRWRDYKTTVQLGELASTAPAKSRPESKIDTSDVEFDWSQNHTLSFAGDLISGAWISGNLEVAREAAEFVLETNSESSVGQSLLELATTVLDRLSGSTLSIPIEIAVQDETRGLIAAHRKQLADVPRDAIRWVDLSLLYAQKGLSSKARRAIQVALDLAPNNRFILRSAARFFMHIREMDFAHHILRKSSLLKIDPWIASAEIAVASAAKLVPFGLDSGKRLLNSDLFSAHETTELAAAFATLEFHHGNTKKTKKYLRSGLIRPNENSLAQAQWLYKNIGVVEDRPRIVDFDVPRSFEALTIEAFQASEWNATISHSIKWLKDEPFARWPVQMAAYTAALLGDYDAAAKLIEFGLIANPQYNGFHISLAFGYASQNRLDEAEQELSRIRGPIDSGTELQILANRGLISFRRGNPSLGRKLYSQTVENAAEKQDRINGTAAMIYWAREEILAHTEFAPEILEQAAELAKEQDAPHYSFLIRELQKQLLGGQ